MEYTSLSPSETERFGIRLSRILRKNDVVLLSGPLGSGKTTLMKGIARGLGILQPIVSPTFVLRRRYPIPQRKGRALNHLDAYRIASAQELRGLLDEAFQENTEDLWCIEWGKKLRGRIPDHRVLLLSLKILDERRRHFRLTTLRHGRGRAR